jgi:hypothetical protein
MKKILSLLLISINLYAGAPIVWSGSDAKLLKSQLDFFSNSKIISGGLNPSSAGQAAPLGSLYLSTLGSNWVKTGSGDTSWTIVGFTGLTANRLAKTSSTTSVTSSGIIIDSSDIIDTAAGQIHSTLQTLTNSTSITWDLNGKQNAQLTLDANGTVSTVSNQKSGAIYFLKIAQNGTGNYTLTFSDAAFKFPNGVEPVISTGASAVDVIQFISDGTYMYGTWVGDYQ